MPRTLSSTARVATFAAETGEIFLLLLTIDAPGLPEPIRVCSAGGSITSRGNEYVHFPFRLTLSAEDGDAPRPATLEIDNVDRRIVEAIRSVSGEMTVTADIVLASTPSTLEAGPYEFDVGDVTFDASVVRAQLIYQDLLNEPFPGHTFNPTTTPGLYA